MTHEDRISWLRNWLQADIPYISVLPRYARELEKSPAKGNSPILTISRDCEDHSGTDQNPDTQ